MQAVFYLIALLVAAAGMFAAGVNRAWIAAIAFVFAAFVLLGYAWPVLSP